MGVTGMADREKVMRGAECCTKDVYDPFSCEECPYLGHKPTKKGCISVMLEDVIALLKAQEPRVMTLEEARETLHTSDFLVMEEPHRSSIFLGHRGEWHFDLSNGEYLDFDDLDVWSNYVVEYGKIFRFWTSRPTEEQRKAVEWNV